MKALCLALPALLAALPAQAHTALTPHAEPHGAELWAGLAAFVVLVLASAFRRQDRENPWFRGDAGR